MEPFALADVMLECRAMVEPQAEKRGIRMTFPTVESPARLVLADKKRVKQVLINLLFNAIKYNAPGGSVAVECDLQPPNAIRIGVRDTGQGLAPEEFAQLFQPFNRLGKESGSEEGTGIGLALSRGLVEAMGGRIEVSSEPGAGNFDSRACVCSMGSAAIISGSSHTA
jgi:signal transduction histidine kinase